MTKRFRRAVLDIETNGFIEHLLDYTLKPMVLKPHARLWCIAIRDFDNQDDVLSLKLNECTKDNLKEVLKDCEELIFHNGIAYDMVMLQLFNVVDYRVGYEGETDTLFGKPIKFIDTLLLSKLLKQDRFGGHSVEAWGKTLGVPKIDFSDFENYSEEMVIYCEGDTLTQANIYASLLEEMGDNGWEIYDKAYRMEVKLMSLTVSQELRGFHFEKEKAEEAVEYFQNILDRIKSEVDEILPPRPLNKGEAKDYQPPKTQIKKNGDLSTHMLNFITRIGAKVNEDNTILTFEGRDYSIPIDPEICLKELVPGTIDNLDYLKAFLLDLGWEPMEWKERDLTKDAKKHKLSEVKMEEAILRYVDNTLNGPYKHHRLEILGLKDERALASFLLSQKGHFSIKVPVSPMLRIGTEKKICDNLKALGKEAEFVSDVLQYLTFKHRRNSIAGSKENDDGDPLTGFLSQVRENGRIGTPADTLGANGGRYRHKVVCNIPRVSSPGGDRMRSLFSCGPKRKQFGFDFSSLEARIQGHYVLPYTEGAALAEALIAEKPNDIHCLSTDTEILTKSGWVNSESITYLSDIANWNSETKTISYTKPTDIIKGVNKDIMINIVTDRLSQRITSDHRVVLYNRDLNTHVTILAKDLKNYLSVNENCFIPSNGTLVADERRVDLSSYQVVKDNIDKVISFSKKESCFVVQSLDLEFINQLILMERLSGSSPFLVVKDLNGSNLYQTSISLLKDQPPLNSDGFKITLNDVYEEKVIKEDVWCVTVPSSYIIIRRHNCISVTGNSINANKLNITRDNAKSFSYACMYGAQAAKLAKMLRINKTESERLFLAYWDAVPALKELRDKVEAFWKSTGKQYIIGIDGRKLFVRSQHSLINLLFQSAGAICVKYTIVGVCRRLEELGILGDPLVDTEEDEKKKVYLMIVYHDEAQFDCPEDFFKIHMYDDEKEAKAASKEYKDSSSVGHNDEGYYFCESNTMDQFINQEIFRVCLDLNLRVPLGMEYIVGTNWAECH